MENNLSTNNSKLSTQKKPKVFFATDHAGFELKEIVKEFVHAQMGYEVEDLGAREYVEGDDYPEYIARAAEKVSGDPNAKAIIFGGSGQGEAIVANRFPHVRAIVWYGNPVVREEYKGDDGRPAQPVTALGLNILRLSREHNNANVLSIGARFLNPEEACTGVYEWLTTSFSNEDRHVRRIEKIEKVLHT